MTFFDKLAVMVSKVENLERKLGVPTRRDLAIRKSHLPEGEFIPQLKDFFLDTVTDVKSVPSKFMNYQLSEGTLIVGADDLYVELPRIYSAEFLTQGIEFYILDPKKNEAGQLIGGITCKFLTLVDDDPVYFGLILRKTFDNEAIEVI